MIASISLGPNLHATLGLPMAACCMTPHGAERIKAAHENYVTALRALNALRCAKPRCGDQPDYAGRVAAARTRLKEAFAEWAMLFEHETGRKLAL